MFLSPVCALKRVHFVAGVDSPLNLNMISKLWLIETISRMPEYVCMQKSSRRNVEQHSSSCQFKSYYMTSPKEKRGNYHTLQSRTLLVTRLLWLRQGWRLRKSRCSNLHTRCKPRSVGVIPSIEFAIQLNKSKTYEGTLNAPLVKLLHTKSTLLSPYH